MRSTEGPVATLYSRRETDKVTKVTVDKASQIVSEAVTTNESNLEVDGTPPLFIESPFLIDQGIVEEIGDDLRACLKPLKIPCLELANDEQFVAIGQAVRWMGRVLAQSGRTQAVTAEFPAEFDYKEDYEDCMVFLRKRYGLRG